MTRRLVTSALCVVRPLPSCSCAVRGTESGVSHQYRDDAGSMRALMLRGRYIRAYGSAISFVCIYSACSAVAVWEISVCVSGFRFVISGEESRL